MTNHNHDINFKTAFTVEKQPGSKVKISGEIPYSELLNHRSDAIKHLGQEVQIDGFRKGNVPESILVSKIGELSILTEMAERALAHFYPHIVDAHQLEVIGHPKIEITKIAPQNPLGFIALVAVVPEIKLANYKKIASDLNKEKPSLDVSDEEVAAQIKDLQRQKRAYDRLQQKAAQKSTETGVDLAGAIDLPTPETTNTDNDLDLPTLTDEYVATLGQPGQFRSVVDFTAKIREHLESQKKQTAAAQHRAKITDTIIEQSQFELPQILIDSEISQMFAQMREDLARASLKLEDYLNHLKKTEADLKKEWSPAAEKRARLQLVLNEIAKVEKIEPDKKELDEQVKNLLDQYKNADELRVRVYVASVMINEAVMQLLEKA